MKIASALRSAELDSNRFLFKNIYYLTLKLRREWFLPYLADLGRSQYWSTDRIAEVQLDRVNALLAHACNHVPYYRERAPRHLGSLDELKTIPLLDKDTVRSIAKDLVWGKGVHQRRKTSGGSTGAPVTFMKDSRGMAQELAATWRGYGWAGIHIGDRQARFWGVRDSRKERYRDSLIDFVCNRVRVSAYGYHEAYFRSVLKKLQTFNPDYLYGYVSILRDFAEFVAQAGSEPLPIRCIVTTAEVLTAYDRDVLERGFGAKVFDEYGCGETGTIAHECERGNRHISAENVVVEILSADGEQARPGEAGEVVVTDLTNYSMPLIRYRLMDFAAVTTEQCECGRGLPVLQQIQGRAYDILENSQGKRFYGGFFTGILADAKKRDLTARAVQIVQGQDLGLTIYLCASQGDFDQLAKFVLRRIRRDFDAALPIRFERVHEVPREPSGKIRLVKKLV